MVTMTTGNQLIQLLYGEDGMDGARVEFQGLPTYHASDFAFEQRLVEVTSLLSIGFLK